MGEVKFRKGQQLLQILAMVLFTFAGMALPSELSAQNSASGNTPPPSPGTGSASTASAGDPEEFATRYVKPENRAEYVAKITGALAMNQRMVDPFGRNQDPNYRPPQPELPRPDTADATQQIPQASLSELVAGIQVTMLMPTKQTFFVGDRAFHRGDRFPLRTPAGTLVNVEILSVNPASIVFREISKGEVGVLRLGGSPAGLQRGRNLEIPPGITIPNPAAPLDLQPAQDPNSPR